MTSGDVRIDWRLLQDFTRDVFVEVGLSSEDAQTEAEVLIWANLRGVDSHGVLRIPSYVDAVDQGRMNPNPNVQILRETPGTMLIDADLAFGPVVTKMAMQQVMEKASKVGIGWAVLRKNTHQGAMGYYTSMAADHGMTGIAIVCSPANMAPFGSKVAGVHNSPIAIGVPANRHGMLNLDMATSVAAGGKVNLAVDKGIPIPLGWALDKEGNPTTDPHQFGALVPVGGPKGSGLALMFQCLTSLMANYPLLTSFPDSMDRPPGQNGVVAAIDIAAITDLERFRNLVDDHIDHIKSLPPAEGHDEVMVPGEPENRVHDERFRTGIPLPARTLQNLGAVAKRFNLNPPEPL